MNKDILERALEKTNEIEEKERKKVKIAGTIGFISGHLVALALDTTAVWAVLLFLVGLEVSWVAVLGGLMLFHIFKVKIRQ